MNRVVEIISLAGKSYLGISTLKFTVGTVEHGLTFAFGTGL
jgi:hypothetical protein